DALGRMTAARSAPCAGAPIRGSITWPYVFPPAEKDLPCTAETDSDSFFKPTTAIGRLDSAAGAARPAGSPARWLTRGGRSMATPQPSTSGGTPIAHTVLVPP